MGLDSLWRIDRADYTTAPRTREHGYRLIAEDDTEPIHEPLLTARCAHCDWQTVGEAATVLGLQATHRKKHLDG